MNHKLCPICGVRPVYIKQKVVNDGYPIQGKNGGYYFKKTGTRVKTDIYRTCKMCTKMKTQTYNDACIKHFNDM